MFFHFDKFVPETVPDHRLRAVLGAVAVRPTRLIRPSDLLAASLCCGDPIVQAVLAQATRPDVSFPAVLAAVQGEGAGVLPAGRRNRTEFSPDCLQILAEVEAFLGQTDPAFRVAALDLLLLNVCMRLDERERRHLGWLDVDRAAACFRDQVERVVRRAPSGSPGADDLDAPPTDAGSGMDRPFLLPPLLAASEDLTYAARRGAPPPVLPFDQEPQYERLFDDLARALHRQQARHVLMVGERGVGKNTVLAEFARRAATGAIGFLASRRFLRVDCRYVPSDESRPRLAALFEQVGGRPELVVCLDGLAALLRGERLGSNKALLLHALSHARCQVLGLLTPREWETVIADDPDYGEFFSRIDVAEPTVEVALKLLRHFARGLQEKFRLHIDDEAVRQAVLLSAHYILNDHLPAKALKVLHRICEDLDYDRSQRHSPQDRVSVAAVVGAVARATGVPEETLRGIAEKSDYEQGLREMIFGQDHAVREVANELGLIKAGMTDPNKPASVLLFLGQTGTGKTEMAKALARFYSTSKRLKTYTLGNCVEPHSVSTIIGVPPGYVGNDQGGRLINELNADPYCVCLLDEADKAHPDVLQPFLNLFDEGWVSDQRGIKAYANHAIFILTSNVGQRMIAEMVREGKGIDEITTRMKEALSQIRHSKSDRPVFTPEFLARLKRVIVFQPLDRAAMAGIARKMTVELSQAWHEQRGKRLEIPDALVESLADWAHRLNDKSGGKEGGRIVRKLLADWVESPLQQEVSRRPQAYRSCTIVTVAFEPPSAEAVSVPAARIDFTSEEGR